MQSYLQFRRSLSTRRLGENQLPASSPAGRPATIAADDGEAIASVRLYSVHVAALYASRACVV